MTDEPTSRPVVLTIAGLDPSGGAGIVADIKTIAAFGCFPAAGITSITFQNTAGVFCAEHQTSVSLRSQIEPVITDFFVAAAKTGMLPTAEIVAEVARLFTETDLPAPVVDPVMVSTSGHDLIGSDAVELLKTKLFTVARIVTPNIPEAERLSGLRITSVTDMRAAAESIKQHGKVAVLVKGGHRLPGQQDAVDVLLNEHGEFTEFRDEYVDVGEVHGSGCTLSAAIASCLALGMNVEDSVKEAKRYVTQRIRALRKLPRIGQGARPIW
jgi:hydroxymethylpyrimidine kinase/phosphomethylpyrimidine kinase